MDKAFRRLMEKAYGDNVTEGSVQWIECHRMFMAGAHYAACELRLSMTARQDAAIMAEGTMAFGNTLRKQNRS